MLSTQSTQQSSTPQSSPHQSIINVDDIKTALEKHKNTVFKINYTKKELECIAKIDISQDNTYSHFGDIAYCNPENFFKEIGNNDSKNIETLCKIVSKLAKAVCKGYSTKHAWIDIRVSNPDNDYDIPRWHTDGNFFMDTPEDRKQIESKFVTVLRGDGTLMVSATKKEKEEYERIMRANSPKTEEEADKYYKDKQKQMELRLKTNKVFENKKVKQLKNNEGLIFIVGNIDKALIHSESP
jgi:phosphopantetheinyl transferase (holo-ACP synthase)